MRHDKCKFEEVMRSLSSDEWKVVFGNSKKIVGDFQASFVKDSGEIRSGALAGLTTTHPLGDAPRAHEDYVQNAIKWLIDHPKKPKVWDSLKDISGLITWKAINLVRDAHRKRESEERKRVREIERTRKLAALRAANRRPKLRRLFEPGGVERFRSFLLTFGGKRDNDALVFFDYCRTHKDAFRPTRKRETTYNINPISKALTGITGSAWPPYRTQNARRHMTDRLNQFEKMGPDQ